VTVQKNADETGEAVNELAVPLVKDQSSLRNGPVGHSEPGQNVEGQHKLADADHPDPEWEMLIIPAPNWPMAMMPLATTGRKCLYLNDTCRSGSPRRVAED